MIQFLMVIVLTELLTELVVKSQIFLPFRKGISKLGGWFEKLIQCGYCLSVWVAAGVVFLTQTSYPLTGISWLDLGLMALVVHRLSNVLHNIIDKWTDKYYSMNHVNTEKE